MCEVTLRQQLADLDLDSDEIEDELAARADAELDRIKDEALEH